MSSGPPPGWDADVPPELLAGVQDLRTIFLAMISVGFSIHEASLIIAGMMAMNGLVNPQAGKNT